MASLIHVTIGQDVKPGVMASVCSSSSLYTQDMFFEVRNLRLAVTYRLGKTTKQNAATRSKSAIMAANIPRDFVQKSFNSPVSTRNRSPHIGISCCLAGVLPTSSIPSSAFASAIGALPLGGLQLDWSILRSSAATSFNLLSLCTFVVWMQRTEQLPAETPVILSQVAYKMLIPCFLMSKVASTLTSQLESNLVALPLMAVAQVIIGASLGKLASRIVYRDPKPPLDIFQNFSTPSLGGNIGEAALSSLEFSKSQRVGITDIKKEALITAACAFGNSLTLPLVFLSGALGIEDSNRAAGYLALYMVGWSPAMWTLGYQILNAGDFKDKEDAKDKSIWEAAINWLGSVMNPPLYGCLAGILIGATPVSHLFMRVNRGVALSSNFGKTGAFARIYTLTAGILSPVFEAATLLGSATLAIQTVVLASSLAASLPTTKKTVNESWKPNVIAETEVNIEKSDSYTVDSKAFWVISVVRLMIMPLAGILLTYLLHCAHLLPADPIYRLTILALAVMPTAQNLVLMSQLHASTRPMAGALADLLLRQYALSVVPITIWMALFRAFWPVR